MAFDPNTAVLEKDSFDITTAKPEVENVWGILGRNLREAARETYREGISPMVSGLSTAGFGLPKALAYKVSPELEKTIFPEQRTLGGKVLRGVSEVGGFAVGGAGRLGLKAGARLVPKVGGELLRRKALRGGISGLVSGASLTPKEDIIAPTQRLQTGLGFGLAGAALPMAGAGISKAKETFGKATADYVKTRILPKAYNIFQNNVRNFTTGIEKFAKDKLKIPQSAINTIKQKGYDVVQKTRQLYGDTTDTIYQKIQQGFTNKKTIADTAYREAMAKTPTGYGETINIANTEKEITGILRKYGMINAEGNPTALAGDPSLVNSQIKKLLDIQQSLKLRITAPPKKPLTIKQMERFLKTGVKREALAEEIRLSKDQYTLLRDNLNGLYKETPTDRNIAQIMNRFYADGETSGLKGLLKAREMERAAFEAEDKFLNSALIKERKLSNFHEKSFTSEEFRQLKEAEKYIGVDFIDDLDTLTAGKYLDKLNEYNPNKFATDLQKAVTPSETKYIQSQYRDLLGEQTDDIFKEIVSHRQAIKIKKGALAGAGLIGATTLGHPLLRRFRMFEGVERE